MFCCKQWANYHTENTKSLKINPIFFWTKSYYQSLKLIYCIRPILPSHMIDLQKQIYCIWPGLAIIDCWVNFAACRYSYNFSVQWWDQNKTHSEQVFFVFFCYYLELLFHVQSAFPLTVISFFEQWKTLLLRGCLPPS